LSPTLDIDIEAEWGDATDWEALADRAAEAAASAAPELAHDHLLVSVVFASDDEVQALNLQWRAKDKPTNVLSFPMLSREEVLAAAENDNAPGMLGDIILAHGVCTREAAEKNITVAAHATHLVIHGLLHLAGLDHEDGEDEAAHMEAIEIKALASIGIADPYGN
jgi:probable rRNA maturation factor